MHPAEPQVPTAIQQGAECAWCRQPFERAHGHPVCCPRCWDRAVGTRKSLQLLPRAEHPLKDPVA